ncbi:gamma-glutamyltranspeptidase 1-like [Phalaenopsis equestris]|uniref:gamma-glutamyltranspeptidase 1-like n=1 Tax=Phalaenopsis equestris TaxID=78828 RepID=UPI0009E20704|nr:gamma-glutamyltranspeptidase 1-like [Phalaenopsis equestris]
MSAMFQISLIIMVVLLTTSPAFGNEFAKHRLEVIKSSHGAVATDDRRCSRIGREVLKEGGHAVDATVASVLCLGVVSSASSGIGGGAFMILRLADGKAQAFDSRETAPLLASENMYGGNTSLKASGALSIGVPGELAGLHEAWNQHGKLPWSRLVRPAAILARAFKISPYLHMQMSKTENEILADEGLRQIFTLNGSLLQIGDLCHNIRLAHTLEAIARHGPQVFYNGSIGIALVKDIRKLGGIITMRDLREYRVSIKEPISADVMGVNILGMPPPSSGGAGMTLILNILSQYGIPSGVSGSLGLHRLIESLKHMFAVRMNLGDPDFVNVTKVLSDMLSPKFAHELKKTILDNMTFTPDHYGGKWNVLSDHGTSHLCIVDGERNAVSMTSTVNSYFGAHILSPSTGILLNNEMDDFSIPMNITANVPPPAPANFIRPLKRPLSSMSPTIVVEDGQLKAVVGASGGSMIIAGTTEVFLNHFAKRMDPLSSVMAPRLYHQLIPNVVQYENWTTVSGDHFEVPAAARQALQKKGHVLQPLAGGTICQFIVHNFQKSISHGKLKLGSLTAVSDPRKGGLPAGY